MKALIKRICGFYNATNKEVRWWAYAAWTTPFVALASLFFIDLIGWDSLWQKTVIVGGVIFFSVAVFWWWWAIFKVARISNILLETAEDLKIIGDEMRKIGKDLYKKDK